MASKIARVALLIFCFKIINAYPEFFLSKSNSYGTLDSPELLEEYSRDTTSEESGFSYLPRRRGDDKEWSDEYFGREAPCQCQKRTYRQVIQPPVSDKHSNNQFKYSKDFSYSNNKQHNNARNGFHFGEDNSKVSEVYFPEQEEYLQETVISGNDLHFKTEDIKRGDNYIFDLNSEKDLYLPNNQRYTSADSEIYFDTKIMNPQNHQTIIEDIQYYSEPKKQYTNKGKKEKFINNSKAKPIRKNHGPTHSKQVFVANDPYLPADNKKGGNYKIENVMSMPTEDNVKAIDDHSNFYGNEKLQIIKGKNGKYSFEELRVKPNDKIVASFNNNEKPVEYVYTDNGEQYEYVVSNNAKEHKPQKYSIPSNIETIKRVKMNKEKDENNKDLLLQEQLYLLPNSPKDSNNKKYILQDKYQQFEVIDEKTPYSQSEPGILVLKPNEELVIMEYPQYNGQSYGNIKENAENYLQYYENYYNDDDVNFAVNVTKQPDDSHAERMRESLTNYRKKLRVGS